MAQLQPAEPSESPEPPEMLEPPESPEQPESQDSPAVLEPPESPESQYSPATLEPPESQEPSPRSQQQMQETTPTGPAEPQRSPVRGDAGDTRQLRVLLTPLARPGRWPLPQKRLLGSYGPDRAPAGKRLRLELPRASGPGSPPENGAGDADSDGSETGETQPDGYSELSAYERKRLKNITENAKFFAALQLHESAARLHQIATKGQPHIPKRVKQKKAEEAVILRRSMRLQRVEPSGLPAPQEPALPDAEEYPQVPAGPLPMVPEDQMENSKVAEDLLATWMRISEQVGADKAEKHTPDIERYRDSLSSMVLSPECIRKVVKSRVCSMAIHPSESITFVAAGDKFGQIGLWNVDCQAEEGAHVFTPHSNSVNCMHFSPCDPAHLLSLSSESLRCGDVTRAVFDEILRTEGSFSSFDFLDDRGCGAVLGHWGGAVELVDRRTPGAASELSADIGFRRTRTVHVHPVDRHYFVAAGSVDVCVYDLRFLKSKGNKPVSCLGGHTKSVASAYFSPGSGHRVVTVCADDMLRIYDTSSLSPTVPVLKAIRHNNNTGRWLTRFRAVWDPRQQECFVVGSMARPRQIEVFRDTGKLLHSFHNPDCLGSVCSINVLHPTRAVLVGGNSSGRLHVFRE